MSIWLRVSYLYIYKCFILLEIISSREPWLQNSTKDIGSLRPAFQTPPLSSSGHQIHQVPSMASYYNCFIDIYFIFINKSMMFDQLLYIIKFRKITIKTCRIVIQGIWRTTYQALIWSTRTQAWSLR